MPVVVLDGPEKAGKTTFAHYLAWWAREIHGYDVRYRHFGSNAGTCEAYLEDDCLYPGLVIYDRSWASESVYGVLLGRESESVSDPWAVEWRTARAVAASGGTRLMLLGPNAGVLALNRTPDDHPVHPATERDAFEAYGNRFGWTVVANKHSDTGLREVCRRVDSALKLAAGSSKAPPDWAGDRRARVVFVGEKRSEWGDGTWLPFHSRYTSMYGRLVPDDAVARVGWTNADVASSEWLSEARLVFACGSVAQYWVKRSAKPWAVIARVPHPAWLYRWGGARDQIAEVEARIKDYLGAIPG